MDAKFEAELEKLLSKTIEINSSSCLSKLEGYIPRCFRESHHSGCHIGKFGGGIICWPKKSKNGLH